MHSDRQTAQQTALAALAASVAGGRSPSLTHNSPSHEQLWGAEEGNVKFCLVQFPTTGSKAYFLLIQLVNKKQLFPKTQTSLY